MSACAAVPASKSAATAASRFLIVFLPSCGSYSCCCFECPVDLVPAKKWYNTILVHAIGLGSAKLTAGVRQSAEVGSRVQGRGLSRCAILDGEPFTQCKKALSNSDTCALGKIALRKIALRACRHAHTIGLRVIENGITMFQEWDAEPTGGGSDGTLVQGRGRSLRLGAGDTSSMAKASSPSPRRCCSPASAMSAAIRARRSRT